MGASGCVTKPDDSLVRFESEAITVESAGGLAFGTIELQNERIIQGENIFHVALEPIDPGAPAEVTAASAWMPAHGHGTSIPIVTALDAGFEVSELMLFMPGDWEVTFDVEIDGSTDQLDFAVDVK